MDTNEQLTMVEGTNEGASQGKPEPAYAGPIVDRRRASFTVDALGLVLASGKCSAFDLYFIDEQAERIKDLDLATPVFGAVATSKRSDNELSLTRVFTIADAMVAELWDNPEKPFARQYPKRFFEVRALGWLLKLLYADVVAGITMVDYDDYVPAPRVPVTKIPSKGIQDLKSFADGQQ